MYFVSETGHFFDCEQDIFELMTPLTDHIIRVTTTNSGVNFWFNIIFVVMHLHTQ